MSKRSRLANRTRMSGFRMVRYSNARDWHKIQSEYRPRFGIWWVTVMFSLGHLSHDTLSQELEMVIVIITEVHIYRHVNT